MAEALGVVASSVAVVQVAMVIGKSVMALREVWKEVKDVPNTTDDLVQQVEAINPMLAMVEQNVTQSLPSPRCGHGESRVGLRSQGEG